jgi:hypothetical protein
MQAAFRQFASLFGFIVCFARFFAKLFTLLCKITLYKTARK